MFFVIALCTSNSSIAMRQPQPMLQKCGTFFERYGGSTVCFAVALKCTQLTLRNVNKYRNYDTRFVQDWNPSTGRKCTKNDYLKYAGFWLAMSSIYGGLGFHEYYVNAHKVKR